MPSSIATTDSSAWSGKGLSRIHRRTKPSFSSKLPIWKLPSMLLARKKYFSPRPTGQSCTIQKDTTSSCCRSPSDQLLRPKPHRNQLRYPRFLHGHAIQHGSDAHGFLAVGDEHKLRLDAHFFDQVGKAADVGLVQRGVHLVQDAERAGRVLEDAHQKRQRRQSLF